MSDPTQLDINEVTAIYETILFRDPDPAGLNFWVGALDSGLVSLQGLINTFTITSEALTVVDPLIRLYEGLFGRAPDIGGLEYWIAQEQNGESFDSIVQYFVSSGEFARDYIDPTFTGSSDGPLPAANAGLFITALYEHLLGRAPEAQGYNYWLGVLGTPTLASEAAVVEGFVNSAEFIADTQNGIIAWEVDAALSALSGTTATTVGTGTYGPTITNAALYQYLTVSPNDVINAGVNVEGDLTDYNGVQPTLNGFDSVSNVTNLILIDGYGNGTDILPVGITLSNIWNLELETAGNAGSSTTGAWFDVSNVSNLRNVIVTSAGAGVDLVQAGNYTDVTVIHQNAGPNAYDYSESPASGFYAGGVDVIGGLDVTVTNSGPGGVVVGSPAGPDGEAVPGQWANLQGAYSDLPSGDVIVNQYATQGDTDVLGGVNVTVTASSDSYIGNIDIGNTWNNTDNAVSGADTNPTGAIIVNDAAEYAYGGADGCLPDSGTPNDGIITVFGGTSVDVTASGDEIIVGDPWDYAASDDPSGNVTIVNTAPYAWGDPSQGGWEEDVFVAGGAAVSVTTNTGDVIIGDYEGILNTAGTGAFGNTEPTGLVTVYDSAIASSSGGGGGDDDACCCDTWTGAVSCVLIAVYGGVGADIIATDACIIIGGIAYNGTVIAPTGDISIFDGTGGTINGVDYDSTPLGTVGGTTAEANIAVLGGNNILIDTDVGNVTVGSCALDITGTVPLPGANPTGTVDITDTSAFTGTKVKVFGGTSVEVTATEAKVEIGTIVPGANGPVVIAPSGAATIGDTGDAVIVANGALSNVFDNIVNQCPADVCIIGTYDGNGVFVTTYVGGVSIGSDSGVPGTNPTGDVTVVDDATGLYSIGGTICLPTSYVDEDGYVTFGGYVTYPDGAVSAGDVEVYGGATVSVSVDDASVIVGAGTAATNPTGDVTVEVTGIQTANQYLNTVLVAGGNNIIVNVTGVADVATVTEGTWDTSDEYSTGSICNIVTWTDAIQVGTATTINCDTGVVTPGTPVTGFVQITDNHSGWNYAPEDITVIGGAGADANGFAVDISTGLVSCGTITVGACPIESGDEQSYINLGDAANGDVSIVQSGISDGVTIYGDDNDAVFVSGGTLVTLTGGSGGIIEDVNGLFTPGGPDYGDPLGTPTLTTVDLTGVDGCITIEANALNTLNIADDPVTGCAEVYVNIDNYDPNAITNANNDLTINLSNAQADVDDANGWYGGTITIGNGTAGSAVTAAVEEVDELSLTFNAATALVFNNTATLEIGWCSSFNDATTVTAGGSGLLVLGDLSHDNGTDNGGSGYPYESDAADLTSVIVTGTGGVYVEIDPGYSTDGTTDNVSFKGNSNAGAGNNEVVIDNNPTTGTGNATVDGGAGADNTIYVNFNGNDDVTAPTVVDVTNFQTLGVVGYGSGIWDATGYKGLVVGIYDYYYDTYEGVDGCVTFANVGTISAGVGASLDILACSNITYSLASDFTAPGTVGITIGQDANTEVGVPSSAATGFIYSEVAITAEINTGWVTDNVGTVTIDSQGTCNVLSLSDWGDTLTTIDITGDAALTLIECQGTVTTVDASGSSGNIDLTGVLFADATVTGGAGFLTVNLDDPNTAVGDTDSVTVGSGGGIVTIGGGGAGSGSFTFGGESVTLSTTPTNYTAILLPEFPVPTDPNDGPRVQITNFAMGVTNATVVGFTGGYEEIQTGVENESVTLTTDPNSGDMIMLTLTSSGAFVLPQTVSYTTTGTDTPEDEATALATAISDNTTLAEDGVTATTNGSGVLEISGPLQIAGPLTDQISFASGGTGASYETVDNPTYTTTGAYSQQGLVTVTNAGTVGQTIEVDFTQSSGPVVQVFYTIVTGDTTVSEAAGLAKAINTNTQAKADFISAVVNGDQVTLIAPASEQITYSTEGSGVGALSITTNLVNTPVILANEANINAPGGLTHYQSVDGVLTEIGTSGTASLADAVAIVDQAGVGTVAAITIGDTTYVIENNGGTLNAAPYNEAQASPDTIVELQGTTGVDGFAWLGTSLDSLSASTSIIGGAGQSITISGDPILTWQNVTDFTDLGSTTSTTYYENLGHVSTGAGGAYAGVILDTDAAGANIKYANVANWGFIDVGGGATSIEAGGAEVSQVGTGAELALVAAASFTLDSFTYDNADGTLVIDPLYGDITLHSLTDNAPALAIVGSGYVEIDALSDNFASSSTQGSIIDASSFSGEVVLGTEQTQFTQNWLTIDVSTTASGCGAFIFSGGDDNTITVGNVISPLNANTCDVEENGDIVIQALGNNDNISVNLYFDACGYDNGALIGAGGNTDTLTLVGGDGCNVPFCPNGDGTVEDVISAAGNKDSAYDLAYDTLANVGGPDCGLGIAPGASDISLGANDPSIQIGAPDGGNSDTTAIVWLGANDVVTINDGYSATCGSSCGDTTADIWVTRDLTGAAISNTATDLSGVTHETINWDGNANLNLFFFNEQNESLAGCTWANSVVNVATATSLGNAVNIAAGQAAVLDHIFDGGSNTTVPTGGPLEIAPNTGLIDWFQYGGNTYIVEANNSSTTAPAAHAALGAGDAVIELIGLVNPSEIGVNHAVV